MCACSSKGGNRFTQVPGTRAAHISITSFSFCADTCSAMAMYLSVNFWTWSWARRSSSSEIFLSFSRFLKSSLPSRRTFRMETLQSSPSFFTTRANCFRRSSVNGGMGILITRPSFEGVKPKSDLRIAFSTSPMTEPSHGWIVINRLSGTHPTTSSSSFRDLHTPFEPTHPEPSSTPLHNRPEFLTDEDSLNIAPDREVKDDDR